MLLTDQMVFVCFIHIQRNWNDFSSYKFILVFDLAVRKMLFCYYKNIWFGIQSSKAAFLTLACMFMVLDHCLIHSRPDTSWVGKVLENDLQIISCGDETSFKSPFNKRFDIDVCQSENERFLYKNLLGCDSTSLMNIHGLVEGSTSVRWYLTSQRGFVNSLPPAVSQVPPEDIKTLLHCLSILVPLFPFPPASPCSCVLAS